MVPRRPRLSHAQREIEAESVAFLVCHRNGVRPKSQTYLSWFVSSDTSVDAVDVYQVMRAAGRVESVLGLGARTGSYGTSDRHSLIPALPTESPVV